MAASQPGGDVPIREFLTALASADSAQGALSAAALAGAMGTSLLLMVTALPTTRSVSVDERTALMQAGAALGDLQEHRVGDAVRLSILRHNRKIEVTVTLAGGA